MYNSPLIAFIILVILFTLYLVALVFWNDWCLTTPLGSKDNLYLKSVVLQHVETNKALDSIMVTLKDK